MSDQNENWERGVLEKLVTATLTEQRRARRWGIFFRLLKMGFLLLVFLSFVGLVADKKPGISTGEHTALVDMQGIIESEGDASADNVIEGLQKAFDDENTVGVILRINSPGGSPVQAGQINDEIRRLRTLFPETPLYVVVDDICASGGYYVAAAADKIFVDKASLIGSIGVLMNGFGFTGTMEKMGIERRLMTAGANKGMLDPFSPSNPADEAYAKTMLADIHEQFINVVRTGRGDRLKETSDTFSGLIWTGKESLEMGLADAYGSVESVAREVIENDKIVDFTAKEDVIERIAKEIGAGAASVFPGFSSKATGISLR